MQPTPEQQKVFDFVKKEVSHGIIDAVAGSGKTTTIIESAEFLSQGKTALFCAFNNSIAKEIKGRFMDKGRSHIVVKTIHALGFDMLKYHLNKDLKVVHNKYEQIIERELKHNYLDEEVEQLLEINNLNPRSINPFEQVQLKKFRFTFKKALLDLVNKYRLTLAKEDVKEVRELILHYNILSERKAQTTRFEEEVAVYFSLVKKIVAKGNSIAEKLFEIDFSDMLYLPYQWQYGPNTKYDFLFIDECQDLSRSQLAVALKYVKQSGRVLAVGDPYQSIYGFTGADIKSFSNVKDKLKANSLTLSYCFRCPCEIIELAQQFRKDITAFNPKEGVVKRIELKEVIELAKPRDLIICRTKAPIQELIFDMIEKGISVEVHEDEIKEFINDLRYLFIPNELTDENPFRQDNFFQMVMERNEKTIEGKSKRFQSHDDQETFIQEETQLLESKLEFIRKQMFKQLDCKTINHLLKKLETLISGGKDAIKLYTIHKAKGLENDTVFVLNYDKMPLAWDGQKEWEKVQERNLQYVAYTRAKKCLYLVKAPPMILEDNDLSLFDIMDDF